MKKWIAGLVISIVAGLAVWFFTQSPHSPFLGPKVELTDADAPERIVAGEEFQVSFRATNQRDRLERDCHGFVSIWPMETSDGSSSNAEREPAGGEEAVARMRRAAADCRTQTPDFHLGGLSNSSTQVLVNCVVHRAGSFRMHHGISCRSGEDSKWQLDHQTFIEVGEGARP